MKNKQLDELSLEEYKNIEFNLLCSFDTFCKKHQVKYSLAYGTLLGSIRHNGFIPWDDDIDVMMLREDYERFLSLSKEDDLSFGIFSPEINKEYYAPYCNIYDLNTILVEEGNSHRGLEIGVKIDIFPVDIVPDDYTEYLKIRRNSMFINRLLAWKRWPLNAYRKGLPTVRALLVKILLLLLPYSYLQSKLRSLCLKYRNTEYKYCDVVCYNPYSNSRFKLDVFDSIIEHQFEDKKFSIISDYDYVLSAIYGNYMKLPPIEKRISWHNFKVYKK